MSRDRMIASSTGRIGMIEVVRAGRAGGVIVDPVAVDVKIGIARPARLVDVPAALVCRSAFIRRPLSAARASNRRADCRRACPGTEETSDEA